VLIEMKAFKALEKSEGSALKDQLYGQMGVYHQMYPEHKQVVGVLTDMAAIIICLKAQGTNNYYVFPSVASEEHFVLYALFLFTDIDISDEDLNNCMEHSEVSVGGGKGKGQGSRPSREVKGGDKLGSRGRKGQEGRGGDTRGTGGQGEGGNIKATGPGGYKAANIVIEKENTGDNFADIHSELLKGTVELDGPAKMRFLFSIL
jgi:hypothetical protein